MERPFDDEPRLKEGEAKVKLHVMVPDLNPAPLASRASEISNIMVMTFGTTSPYYLKDSPQPCIIEFADTPDESYYVATLNATTDPRLVVIVANASAALLSYTYTVDVTTLADVELFKTQALTTAVIGGTTYITQHPEIACMEGRVTLPSIQNGMIITDSSNPVPLTRGTAQIVVDSSPVSVTDLEILGASLCNAPLRGFIFPQSTIATSGEAHHHYTSSNASFLPFVGAESSGQKSEPLYCYEDSKDNGLFVLLEANYKGVHGYYRINMVDGVLDDFDYDRNPIDIVRNTLYTVNIYKASNYGYTTIAEAINNRASNIEYTVTAYVPSSEQYEDAHDIISNGDYFLGVSNSAFVSYSSGATGVIATTLTHNATATVTTASISVSGTGLTLVTPSTGTYNPGDVNKKLNITVSMSTAFTTGTITIVLGNLTKVITVEQRPPIPFIAGVVNDFAIGNEHFTGMLIPVSGVTPDWLKFSTSADGSNSVEEITNIAGKIYIVHDHNIVMSGGATRSGSVYITRDDEKGRVKALFTQNYLNADEVDDNTPSTINTYVGAFWKANQTGERLIRITRPSSSSVMDGKWTAVVIDGASWIKLDKLPSVDMGVWTSGGPSISGNDLGFDALHTVIGTATSVSGEVGASPMSTEIYFRIGLRSTYVPTSLAPARYGIVLLASNEGNVLQRIWIRQGEEADYLMRPQDPGIGGPWGSPDPRPDAQKFSPYNLSIPAGGTWNADVGYRGGGFTQYPSQAGAYFQWANTGTRVRYAWEPSGPVLGWENTTHASAGYWDGVTANTHETCPPGFRRPSNGTTTGNNAFSVIGEMGQSLWLNPKGDVNSTDNATWGYYADGFFDRRSIVNAAGTFSLPNSTVSSGSVDIAYIGRVLFNPFTHASLFLPAAGILSYNPVGSEYGRGMEVRYMLSSKNTISGIFEAYWTQSDARIIAAQNPAGWPIRCVVEPSYLSVNPTTLYFAWDNTTTPETVTVSTNQTSWSTSTVGWLTISTSSSSFTVVPNSNNSTSSPRTASITITAGVATPVTIYVTQGPDLSTIPDVPLPNSYVGAFWRYDQTGERIIRITNIPSGSEGDWIASVAWMDGKWSVGDIVLDMAYIDDPSLTGRGIDFTSVIPSSSISDAESSQLSGVDQWISGTVATNGTLMFRIGLKSKFLAYDEFTNPARYAVVLLSYNLNDTPKNQKIFLRQGEGADNVSTSVTYSNVKWSPYNVGDYFNPTYYDGHNKIVDFPTKTGFYYQWGYGPTAVTDEVPRPYHAHNMVPLSPSWTVDDTNNTKYTLTDVCPTNYRVPTGAEASSVGLYSTGFSVDNYLAGNYADGYFDRRMIVSNMNVSSDNDDIAYHGKLVFNPSTNASLFFPISGFRTYTSNIGFQGSVSHFKTSDIVDATNAQHLHANYNDPYLTTGGSSPKSTGANVRCVYIPMPQLSVSPPALFFDWDNTTQLENVSVTSNQTWSITGNTGSSWLSALGSGTGNGTIAVLPLSNNNGIGPRSAIVTVYGGGLTETFTVTQESINPTLTFEDLCADNVPPVTFMPYNLGADPQYDTPKKQMEYLATLQGTRTYSGGTIAPLYDGAVLGGLFQWGRKTPDYTYAIDMVDYRRYPGSQLNAALTASATENAVTGQIITYDGTNPADNLFLFAYPLTGDYDWRLPPRRYDLWGNHTAINTPTGSIYPTNPGVPYNGNYYQSTSWVLPQNNPCPAGWRVPTEDELERIFLYDCNPTVVPLSSTNVTATGVIRGHYILIPVSCQNGMATPSTAWALDVSRGAGHAIYRVSDWNAANSNYKDGTWSLYDAGAPDPVIFIVGYIGRRGPASGAATTTLTSYLSSSPTFTPNPTGGEAVYTLSIANSSSINISSIAPSYGATIRCVADM